MIHRTTPHSIRSICSTQTHSNRLIQTRRGEEMGMVESPLFPPPPAGKASTSSTTTSIMRRRRRGGRARSSGSTSSSTSGLLLLLSISVGVAYGFLGPSIASVRSRGPAAAATAWRPSAAASIAAPAATVRPLSLVLFGKKKGSAADKAPPPSPPAAAPVQGVLYEGGEDDEEDLEFDEDEEEMLVDAEVLEFEGLLAKGAFQLVEAEEEEENEAAAYDDDKDEEDEDEYDEDEDEDGERSGRPRNDPEWQFFDTAKVYVKAGDGGDGCVSFRREKYVDMGGPNGGTGGSGGSIYLRCDEGLNTLAGLRSKVHWRAGNGGRGSGKSRTGASSPDIVIDVPPGTIVRTMEGVLAGQLVEHGQTVLVARGGRGGRGNEAFKSERNNAPKLMEKGEPGGERWLQVELKLVADVGLVGVPNAGKSTLLSAVSNARPKIADYPFTTIVPNLGVWDASETVKGEWVEKGLVLADIPGLLEGAHQGIGLGLAFLRHVQRCRVLIHVVNGDSPDPVGDYLAINQELSLFNPKLAEKPQVVVLNKIDLPHVAAQQAELEEKLKAVIPHTRFMAVSAMQKTNTAELMHRVWKMMRVMKIEEEDLLQGEVPVPLDEESYRMSYQIITDPKYPGQFRVQGKQIEKIVAMTNWDYYEAVERFQRILDATGINKTLKKRGAKEGDLIMIGDQDFDFSASTNVYVAAAAAAAEHYRDKDD